MMVKNHEKNSPCLSCDEKGDGFGKAEKQSLLSCDEKLEDEEHSQKHIDVVPSSIPSPTENKYEEESTDSSSTKSSSVDEQDAEKTVSALTYNPASVESNEVSEAETTQEHLAEEKETDQNHDKFSQRKKNLRKAGVAVAGGALITVGVPLIPVLCTGELMIIGGMALLATEFDSAKKVLTKGKEKLVEFAENDDEMSDSSKAAEKQQQQQQPDGSGSKAEEMDEAINKVEQMARHMAKNMKLSMKKMVKKDILPMIDRFTDSEKKGEKSVPVAS